MTRPAGGPWLTGIGTGDLFLQSATAIFRVELATGQVTRTPTPRLEQFSSFVAGSDWVISKTVDDGSGVVVKNGQPARPLPPALQPVGRLDPAPEGHLWLTPEESTRGRRLVTRVTVNGARAKGQTILLPDAVGFARADGAGYLTASSAGHHYQYRPGSPVQIATGDLVALGAHHLLVWDCDRRARCDSNRINRADSSRSKLFKGKDPLSPLYDLGPGEAAAAYGQVTPNGKHVALPLPNSRLTALNLATGRSTALPGSLTGVNGNDQFSWTPNSRWLFAITNGQVRAYDSATNATKTMTVTDEPLLHLTMTSATGN